VTHSIVQDPERAALDDAQVLALVTRLARPHRSGGTVVERAAIVAAGGDATAILAWIADRGGVPEAPKARPAARGLHSPVRHGERDGDAATPLRFVLPAGALA